MQTKMKKLALALGTAGLLGSGYAYGGQIACNGSFANMTFDGNVIVKVGMTCVLDDVTITGNLDVKGGTVWFREGENDVFGNVSVSDSNGFDGVLRVGCEGCDTLLQIGTSSHAANLDVKNSMMSSARVPSGEPRGHDTVTVFGNATIKNTARESFRQTITTLNVNGTGPKPALHNLDCKDDDVLFDHANVSGKTNGDGSCVP